MSVQAVCKVCNNSAPSEQFRLHYKHRMMVCPNCFKKDPKKPDVKKEPQKVVRPPGWDQEDEYLEKISKMKAQDQPQFKRIPGTDQVKCTCLQCKYEFKYDVFRKKPHCCPYCSADIPRMKTYNFL